MHNIYRNLFSCVLSYQNPSTAGGCALDPCLVLLLEPLANPLPGASTLINPILNCTYACWWLQFTFPSQTSLPKSNLIFPNPVIYMSFSLNCALNSFNCELHQFDTISFTFRKYYIAITVGSLPSFVAQYYQCYQYTKETVPVSFALITFG